MLQEDIELNYKQNEPVPLVTIPFEVETEFTQGLAPAEGPTTQSEYICEWSSCQHDCGSHQMLVLHVNKHIQDLSWDMGQKCQWSCCWNGHLFEEQSRLVEHIRAHTLEKPFMVFVFN